MRFYEILGRTDCPYEFGLDLKNATVFEGKAPYPRLVVLNNETIHVRSIKWQVLDVRATMPETQKLENVRIMRLVAVLEGGGEVEMSRVALPADVVDDIPADPTKCAACGGKIPVGSGVRGDDGKYYHRGMCWG